jgi:cell wall-associated NlpC family hydrolase
MKRQGRSAILLAAVALLFVSISGFAKNTSVQSKSSAKHKKIKKSSQPTSKLNSNSIYKIRRGDSLYEIARRFKTTQEALMSANQLSSAKLRIGQELKVSVAQSAVAAKKTPHVDPKAPIITANVSKPEDLEKASNSEAQSLRHQLVEAGFQLIGVRYRFSGLSEKNGLDCSGLVKNLFSKFDIELPRSSREQYQKGEKVDKDKLEAGDLVFFSSGGNRPTHVGIYLGNDQFLHAARKAKQVVVTDLSKFWDKMRFVGARRIIDLWWEEPAATPEKE